MKRLLPVLARPEPQLSAAESWVLRVSRVSLQRERLAAPHRARSDEALQPLVWRRQAQPVLQPERALLPRETERAFLSLRRRRAGWVKDFQKEQEAWP